MRGTGVSPYIGAGLLFQGGMTLAMAVSFQQAHPGTLHSQVTTTVVLGVIGFELIVPFVLGRAVTRLGLPAISGYIGVGLLSGPYLLGWLHPAFAVLGHSA